uniref:Uncharacterized protein n=1 Tax=Rhizophora mucronata TaxID=61149 RepID=A0A2P2P8Q3_RHIMU
MKLRLMKNSIKFWVLLEKMESRVLLDLPNIVEFLFRAIGQYVVYRLIKWAAMLRISH